MVAFHTEVANITIDPLPPTLVKSTELVNVLKNVAPRADVWLRETRLMLSEGP